MSKRSSTRRRPEPAGITLGATERGPGEAEAGVAIESPGARHRERATVSRLPWYVTRASGLTAWGLVLVSIVWGLAMALPRVGFARRAGPSWTLSLHRFFGALALAFVGVHVGSLLVDDFVGFSPVDVVVPFATGWHPVAVASGIVAMYLLVAVEVTSLLRSHLPHRAWRQVHLLAYAVFALSTVHMLSAGTDVTGLLTEAGAITVGTVALFAATSLWVWRNEAPSRRVLRASNP